jgi:hypothetical protein
MSQIPPDTHKNDRQNIELLFQIEFSQVVKSAWPVCAICAIVVPILFTELSNNKIITNSKLPRRTPNL